MIEVLVYDDQTVERYPPEEISAARDAAGTAWVRVSEGAPDELARVAEAFDIHPLSVDDVREGVRPKTEQFPNHTFLLLWTATLSRGDTTFDEEIRSTRVGLFVGQDWLVTLSTGTTDAVQRTWDTAVADDRRLTTHGPDFLAYRVTDGVIDGYFSLLDELEELIESVEESVLDEPDPDVLSDLNAVRRDLLSFRKVVWPTRDAVGAFARGDPDEVRETTEKYYRDAYDHLVQLVDLTETYRDLARGARDIYLNTVAQSTNEVTKVLTVVATVILPLTLVVGVFGMNFADARTNMPELGWTFAYPAVMLGMAGAALVLLAYFRQEGWL